MSAAQTASGTARTDSGEAPADKVLHSGATIPHIAALDGLRGCAVAGVLLFHAGHLTGGYLGVDLFFVLSGFLITSLLLAEANNSGRISLRSFWARRARRLLPALAGVLVGVMLYAAFLASTSELHQIRGDALATIAYVANWRAVLAGNDYFALFRSPSPLQHTWSLAIEEQFYLIWPLVFVAVMSRWKRDVAKAMLTMCLVLSAASTGLMLALFNPANPARVYYGTDTRATAILLGAALAASRALRAREGARARVPRRGLEVAGFAGVAVLVVAWTSLTGDSVWLYRGGFMVCGIAATAVIAAASHPEGGPLAHVLSWRPLCLLGAVSYGVYLWHWPVDIVFDQSRVGLSGWPLFFVQVSITLAVSIASFRLLERPIRRGRVSTKRLGYATPVVAVLLVALTFWATSGSGVGVAQDQGPQQAGGILVVGDSVAKSVAPGLREAGYAVADGGLDGCRVVDGAITFNQNRVSCPWRLIWPRLLRQFHPKVVILVSGGWDLYSVTPPNSSHTLSPGTPEWAAYYEKEMQEAVELLHSTGAPVIVPTIPCFGHVGLFDTLKALEDSPFNPVRPPIANSILTTLAARDAGFLSVPDLYKFLCPAGKYQKSLDGVSVVRVDGVHFTPAGSRLVVKWLAPLLSPARKEH